MPARIHVDPGLGHELVLETVAHEWIHSIEFRGLVPRRTLDVDGGCSALALGLGRAIRDQAAVSPAHVALPDALTAAIVQQTGRPPVCYAQTRRSVR